MGRLLLVAVLWLAACGRSGYEFGAPVEPASGDGRGRDGDVDPLPELVVEPLVPGAPTAWNSYMRTPTAASLDFVVEDCAAPGRYRDCLHAGELRRVAVPAASSCAGLAITATPAFFTWQCVETTNGPVFVTTWLAPGVGLRDLIDFETLSFRPVTVTVTEPGRGPRVSAETVWWNNPVRVVPAAGAAGRVIIDDPEVVYLVPATLALHGIDVRADGVALVGAPGARLTAAPGTPPETCESLSFGTHVPSASSCALHAQDVERVWIELDTGGPAGFPGMTLSLDNTRLARVHRSRFSPSTGLGMQLRGALASRMTDVTIERGAGNIVFASDGNLFTNLRLAGTDLYIYGSDANVFEGLTTFGGFAGININGSSSGNAFVRSLSFSHSGHGLQIVGSGNVANVFVGTTFAASTLAGAGLWAGDRTTLHLSAIVNSGKHGIDFTSSAVTVSHLATAANNFAGVEIQNQAQWLRFAGILCSVANGAQACEVGALAVGPALTAPACDPANLSDDVLRVRLVSADIGSAFVGYVGDDPVNVSDGSGATEVPAPGAPFDYGGASSRYRGWMAGGTSPLLGPGNRDCPGNGTGGCWNSTGAPMRIVDWSLRALDSDLFNRTIAEPNAPFVSGEPCPVGLGGADFIMDLLDGELLGDGVGDEDGVCEAAERCSGNTYVGAAIEVIDDYDGDDDGLCETDEQCIYAPNFGAYQGHGDYRLSRCVFADGTVTNVTMFAYPENGYPAGP